MRRRRTPRSRSFDSAILRVSDDHQGGTVKKILFALIGAATVGLGPALLAQQPPPEIPFDADINFLKLPAGMNFGEASGVAVNSKGEIAVFTRSNSAGGPAYGATASQVLR